MGPAVRDHAPVAGRSLSCSKNNLHHAVELAVRRSSSGGQDEEPTMQVNTYRMFNGTCETAFKFYEKVLGGKIEAMIPQKASRTEGHVPTDSKDKIMHARLPIGDT